MDKERMADLAGLCERTLEYERKDFYEVLTTEPDYVESGVITPEELDTLKNGSNDEIDSIILHAARHPEAYHVYALATRLHEDIVIPADCERRRQENRT